MLKYHLVDVSSEIFEDDYLEGEKDSTGCGLNGQPIGRTFDSIAAAVDYLAEVFGLPEAVTDYGLEPNALVTSKQVANHGEAQNGGWFEPTSDEVLAWKRGEQKLYSEDFIIRFVRCI